MYIFFGKNLQKGEEPEEWKDVCEKIGIELGVSADESGESESEEGSSESEYSESVSSRNEQRNSDRKTK